MKNLLSFFFITALLTLQCHASTEMSADVKPLRQIAYAKSAVMVKPVMKSASFKVTSANLYTIQASPTSTKRLSTINLPIEVPKTQFVCEHKCFRGSKSPKYFVSDDSNIKERFSDCVIDTKDIPYSGSSYDIVDAKEIPVKLKDVCACDDVIKRCKTAKEVQEASRYEDILSESCSSCNYDCSKVCRRRRKSGYPDKVTHTCVQDRGNTLFYGKFKGSIRKLRAQFMLRIGLKVKCGCR